ncbi:MAG: hypothetical protein PHI12_13615 [Dehalococcoidales bacterium]|nr:hypothetical protein [Dehalococcoidales bacterium]
MEERIDGLEARVFEIEKKGWPPPMPDYLGLSLTMRRLHVRYRQTDENYELYAPMFYKDLEWMRNMQCIHRAFAGIIKSIMICEQNFNSPFGGMLPTANEFGITSIREMEPMPEDFIVNSKLLIMLLGYYDISSERKLKSLQITANNDVFPLWQMNNMVMRDHYFIIPKPVIMEPGSRFRYSIEFEGEDRSEFGFIGYLLGPDAMLASRKIEYVAEDDWRSRLSLRGD